MFANSQLAGMSITFPDICKTPPVGIPIPYPNFSFHIMATGFVILTVLAGGAVVLLRVLMVSATGWRGSWRPEEAEEAA